MRYDITAQEAADAIAHRYVHSPAEANIDRVAGNEILQWLILGDIRHAH